MRKHHSQHKKEQMQHPVHHEEVESSDDEYSQQMSLLAINKQAYSIPVAASNSSDRVQQLYNFNPNSYSGVNNSSVAQIIFNVGSSFVNGPTSTVNFSVNFPLAPKTIAWSWGDNTKPTTKSGSSCANIIKECSLTARSGEIIERVINCNVLTAALAPFEKGVGGEYLWAGAGGASICCDGGIQGQVAPGTIGYTYPMYYACETQYFELPLGKLLNFFGQAAPIPGSTVLSGSKLSLTFDNFLNAMTFYTVDAAPNDNNGKPPVIVGPLTVLANPAVNLTIGDMTLMADTMTLFDSSLQLINAAAASLNSSGLQLSYYNVYQSRTTLNNSSATIDVLLAASKLKDVILVFRSAAAPDGSYDNMARLPLVSYTGAANSGIFLGSGNSVGKLGAQGNLRLRIGSNLNSLVPISSASQLYRYTTQALCAVKNGATSDIAPLHSENRPLDQAISYSDWYFGSGGTTIAFDVERSANLSVSGSASNNSRAIQIEINNCMAVPANPIVLDIYVRFLSVLNASLENCIVDK